MKWILGTIALGCALMVIGCGPKEADPNAKIDAPGYYNGPMDPKKAGPESAGDETPTTPKAGS